MAMLVVSNKCRTLVVPTPDITFIMKSLPRVKNAFLTLAVSAALIQSGFAETSAATSGNWGVSGTWTNDVPVSSSGVGIGGNHTVTFNTLDIYTGGGFYQGLLIGYGSWGTSNWGNPPPAGPFITNPGDGILNVAGGTLNTGYLALGDATSLTAKGTLNITGGVVNNDQDMLVSWAGPGSSINISGGSFIQSGVGTSNIGQGAAASFNATGGITEFTRYTGVRFGSTVNVSGSAVMSSSSFFMVGDGQPGSNELNINGGTFNQTGADLRAGNFATGTVTVNSGNLNLGTSNLVVGIGGGTGLVDINGGSVTSSTGTVTIGNNTVGAATGTFNVDGGTFEKTGGDFIVSASGTTGTVNQTGGTFGVANFVNGGGTGSYNFTGGTLKANAAINMSTYGITTNITGATGGGSTINTNGNTVTANAAQVNLGAGGVLTKAGAGSFTILGDKGFDQGTWNVNAGSVDMVGYFNGANVNVAGGTLNISRAGGTHLALASTSTTTLSSGVIFSANDLYLGFSTGGNGTLNQSGGNLNVTAAFNVGGSGGVGTVSQTAGTITAGNMLISAGSSADLDGTVTVGTNINVLSGALIGGDGTVVGNLDLNAGANFQFSLTETLTSNGGAVGFGGFGIDNLIGLDSLVANGTYVLIDGSSTFNYANVSHIGVANAFDLGGGKSAYFDGSGLQVNVIPEPSAYALVGLGLVAVLLLRKRRLAQA